LLKSDRVNQTKNATGLTGSIYATIRDGILSGSLAPDAHLKQLHLAEEFGVNQRTVRDALLRLVESGLAVHKPYKGIWVASLQLEEVKDIYCARKALERCAVETAAKSISREDLGRMKQLLPFTCGNSNYPKTRQTQEANREFHWIAIRASRRQQLSRLLEQVWDLSLTYTLRETLGKKDKRKAVATDLLRHTELLEALESRDALKAGEVISQHIQESCDNLIARCTLLREGEKHVQH